MQKTKKPRMNSTNIFTFIRCETAYIRFNLVEESNDFKRILVEIKMMINNSGTVPFLACSLYDFISFSGVNGGGECLFCGKLSN